METKVKTLEYIINNNNDTVSLTRTCIITKELYSVTVDKDEYYAWRDGRTIQLAMPTLTTEQYEFMQTGITPAEWNHI